MDIMECIRLVITVSWKQWNNKETWNMFNLAFEFCYKRSNNRIGYQIYEHITPESITSLFCVSGKITKSSSKWYPFEFSTSKTLSLCYLFIQICSMCNAGCTDNFDFLNINYQLCLFMYMGYVWSEFSLEQSSGNKTSCISFCHNR